VISGRLVHSRGQDAQLRFRRRELAPLRDGAHDTGGSINADDALIAVDDGRAEVSRVALWPQQHPHLIYRVVLVGFCANVNDKASFDGNSVVCVTRS
jgi:hypothetical protein